MKGGIDEGFMKEEEFELAFEPKQSLNRWGWGEEEAGVGAFQQVVTI